MLALAKVAIYKALNRPWPIALTYGGRKLWGWKPLSLWRPHEPETARFFESYVKPGMRVADVGANVGWYTLMFSDLVGREGHVDAYEPDTISFARLEKGVRYHEKKRGYSNIKLHNAAVAAEEGTVTLFGKAGSGRNSTSRADVGVVVSEVPAVTLPNDVDIAKIDVEGGELEVLRGSLPRAATVEYSFTLFKRSPDEGRKYLESIRALGYDIFFIKQDGSLERLSGIPKGKGHVNLFVKLSGKN